MYNRSYNTRNSGRFNTGQFVTAVEPAQQPIQQQQQQQLQQQQQQSFQGTPRRQQQLQPQSQPNLQEVEDDVDMKPEFQEMDDGNMTSKNEDRPAWMKSKLSGVKKISNKERRRRQNETLRRLLTPKNALMVLNEMMPHEQITSQFKVEASQNQYYARNTHNFCADLTLEGTNYKGYGDNKLSARNSAAEQAIRDLIIRKMNKVVGAAGDGSQNGDEPLDEESLPMIQLASFALHKLFTEWECEGHRVPHLRPTPTSVSESGGVGAGGGSPTPPSPRPKKAKGARAPRALPDNACAMHPCMLLAYMRPRLEYRELNVEGDRPQNMMFTMGVDVDGATYIGKASNKKEARKCAARAACSALFFTHFTEGGGAPAPAPAAPPAAPRLA